MTYNTGDIIIKKYILIKQIGEGRFSIVWLAIDFIEKKYVAIKIFERHLNTAQTEIDNLIDLFDKNILICHNCLAYIDYHINEKEAFIVQPMMYGSLYTIMKKQFKNGFPQEFVKKIIPQLLEALKYVHSKGYAHCDIKPENIFLVGMSPSMKDIIDKINLHKNNSTINKFSDYIKKILATNEENNDDDDEDDDDENSESSTNRTIDTDSEIISSCLSKIDRDYIESECELESEEDNEYNDEEDEDIEEDYINNPRIVLADFGSSIKVNELKDDIQTRHYRSPEIILRLKLNEKIDIWAMGCTIYELLKGKVLFNPNKTRCASTDLEHLYEMQCVFGIFPKMYLESRKKNVFFRKNGLIKKYKNITFEKNIFYKLMGMSLSDEFINHILNYFEYDIDKRKNACELFEDVNKM